MIFGIHIGNIILGVCGLFWGLVFIYAICLLVIDYFKPKPPVFLGPKRNIRLEQEDEYKAAQKALFPDGVYREWDDDGEGYTVCCKRTDEIIFHWRF